MKIKLKTPISLQEFTILINKIPIKNGETFGVAVSGGVDILALIIDHKLREDSMAESLNVSDTLSKIVSQLETMARIERYKLLAKLCKENNIKFLFLGHHLNDQLETMIMRFSRGSGIDGLAGMDITSRFPIIKNYEALDISIVRPLLSITKERLRLTCENLNLKWFEDPTNKSLNYKRNLIRFHLNNLDRKYNLENKLEFEPLSTTGLTNFLNHMKYHKIFINSKVDKIIKNFVNFDSKNGICILYLSASTNHWLTKQHLATRILNKLINWVNCSEHNPRLESVLNCYKFILKISSNIINTTNSSTRNSKENFQSNITINGVLICQTLFSTKQINKDDKLRSDIHHFVFSRQPFILKKQQQEEQKNEIPIKNGEIILWDKRFFIGVKFLSSFSSLEHFFIRALNKKDLKLIRNQLSLSSKDDYKTYKESFENYLKKIPPICRYTIPVLVIKNNKLKNMKMRSELMTTLKEDKDEVIVGLPSLEINFLKNNLSIWSKFCNAKE
ncbi:7152_t:CDS:2 [Entrophospora sp. SA101]|nr:7152_t:CDS:2 [Entrophospora sp. SA101]